MQNKCLDLEKYNFFLFMVHNFFTVLSQFCSSRAFPSCTLAERSAAVATHQAKAMPLSVTTVQGGIRSNCRTW